MDTNNVMELIEECKNILKSLNPKEFLTQLINLNIAIAYLSKGKLKEAWCYFEKCISIGIETKQLYIVIVANKALASAMMLRGEYSKIKKQNEKLILDLMLENKVLIPTMGLLYAQLAEIYSEWNEHEKAFEYAKKGLKLGIDGEDIWTISTNYLALAKIYSAMAQENNCMTSIEKAEETIENKDLFDIRLRVECYKAEVMLKRGLKNPISKWLKDIIFQKKENLAVVYPEIYVVKIKYYINEKMFHEAKEILEMLRVKAEENELMGLLIQVEILSSIIHNKLLNEDEALRALNYAIDLSLRERPVQVYINEGNIIRELLIKLRRKLKNNISEGKNVYIDRIISIFKSNIKHISIEKTMLLKEREIEILKLMQEGASNSEISEELFISINTVKTHILNIYGKLDVHSRTKAIAKAKELNLMK